MSEKLSEEELEKLKTRCLRGDDRAWEALYKEMYRYAWWIARRGSFGLSREDSEDVAHEAMLALTERLRDVKNVRAFVGCVAHNKCVDKIEERPRETMVDRERPARNGNGVEQKRPRKTIVSLEGSSSGDDGMSLREKLGCPPEEIVDSDVVQDLLRTIEGLDERCRRLLTARFLHELAHKEVAERVGVPADQARVNVARCMVRLKTLLLQKRPRLWAELAELGGEIRYELAL